MRWLTFLWFMGATAVIFVVLGLFSYFAGPGLLLGFWDAVAGPLVRRAAQQAVIEYQNGAAPDPAILVLPLETKPEPPFFEAVWKKLQNAPDGLVVSAAQFRYVSTGVVIGAPVSNKRFACYIRLATRPVIVKGIPGSGLRIVAFLLIALGISYAFASQITRPIEQMRSAARKFASGDLRARVGPTQFRAPELRELATDFDDMAARIESQVLSQRRLLTDVSHELRSPLSRLSLAVGIARHGATAETDGALDRIESEADNLNRLIGRVLELSRLEAGAAPKRERVELSPLLKEIVENANFEADTAATGKQVTLTVEKPYTMNGDPELLSSAIENVIRNASHYTAKNTAVEVRLSAAGVAVRDHGPGVPEEKLRAIFEPFFRLDAGREKRMGGAGLGLAIARRAIELHKGDIAVRNHPTGGLEVGIRLPGLTA